jgi:hypothetical protein
LIVLLYMATSMVTVRLTTSQVSRQKPRKHCTRRVVGMTSITIENIRQSETGRRIGMLLTSQHALGLVPLAFPFGRSSGTQAFVVITMALGDANTANMPIVVCPFGLRSRSSSPGTLTEQQTLREVQR